MNKALSHKKQISKKVGVQMYFIIFIILNVLDFLNLLQGDIDFFKKLLSWLIIGYIFYIASFTKIFIGVRDKLFDSLYLIAFSLMAIIKSLVLYVNLESTQDANFYVFGPIIFWLENVSPDTLIQNSFILGVLLVIITSGILMARYTPTQGSLIGSLNIKGYLKFVKFEFVMLTLTAIFFGLIVFNFFMEWFALAVDSLILVAGLIYYIFKFIHDHTKTKFSYQLRTISNTGNSFYQNILEQFSDKKTFFIGVSFILTLLLLVDVGVYIIPYVIGNENTLYAANLDQPLLSFTDPLDSRLYTDLTTGNVLISLEIIIVYISTIFLISALMILPFLYFYRNIQKQIFHIPKIVVALMLISALIFVGISAVGNLSYPISITESDSSSFLYGVKISTTTVLQSAENMFMNTLFLTFILMIAISAGYFFYRDPNMMLVARNKILPGIVLLFFVIYILMFFYTTIKPDIENANDKIVINENVAQYDALKAVYENEENYKEKRPFVREGVPSKSSIIKVTPFSDKSLEQISSGANHFDYIFVEIENLDTRKLYKFDINQLYFNEKNIPVNGEFDTKTIEFIVPLGESKFMFADQNGVLRLNNRLSVDNIINVKRDSSTPFEEFTKILRLLFSSIFYMIGTLEFTRFFIKRNII